MLTRYAERLGLTVPLPSRADGVRAMKDTGFIRVDRGPMSAILDVGKVGPDHVPGHGHADTLTFEWSLADQRVVVDTGTSLYGESPERLRQRGTAAHNTVVVNDPDSSEVWKGFRVARRAYPRDVTVDVSSEPWRVSAAHDGYWRLPVGSSIDGDGSSGRTRCLWQTAWKASMTLRKHDSTFILISKSLCMKREEPSERRRWPERKLPHQKGRLGWRTRPTTPNSAARFATNA